MAGCRRRCNGSQSELACIQTHDIQDITSKSFVDTISMPFDECYTVSLEAQDSVLKGGSVKQAAAPLQPYISVWGNACSIEPICRLAVQCFFQSCNRAR
eukprot:350331-Chlamydomonas_euryale.AAC.6